MSLLARRRSALAAACILLVTSVGATALPPVPVVPRVPRVPLAAPPHAVAASMLHLHLEKSEPAANDTVKSAPAAVRLWFSEQPELAVTTVRLTGAPGGPVALAPLTRDAGADAPVVAPLRARPAAGTYTVWWRSTAADGHVSTGQFQFVIAAGAPVSNATRTGKS